MKDFFSFFQMYIFFKRYAKQHLRVYVEKYWSSVLYTVSVTTTSTILWSTFN